MTLGLVIFFCTVTWLITMMYYTERYKVLLHDEGLAKVRCVHCAKPIITEYKNLRAPMYCNWCK
jgi:hypothetical protein